MPDLTKSMLLEQNARRCQAPEVNNCASWKTIHSSRGPVNIDCIRPLSSYRDYLSKTIHFFRSAKAKDNMCLLVNKHILYFAYTRQSDDPIRIMRRVSATLYNNKVKDDSL